MTLDEPEIVQKGPQDNLVKFTVDNQPIEIKLADVNRLFTDMDRYNDQFSIGNMLARVITSRLKPIEPGEEERIGQPKASIAEEEGNQQVNAFFLAAAHRSLLNNIGLAVEPISGKTATIEGVGGGSR